MEHFITFVDVANIPFILLQSLQFPTLVRLLIPINLLQRILEIIINDLLHKLGLLVLVEVDVGAGLFHAVSHIDGVVPDGVGQR